MRIWIASRQCSAVNRHGGIHMQEYCKFKWNEQRFYGKLHFRDAYSRVAMIAAEVDIGRIVISSKQTRLAEVHRAEGYNTLETIFSNQ